MGAGMALSIVDGADSRYFGLLEEGIQHRWQELGPEVFKAEWKLVGMRRWKHAGSLAQFEGRALTLGFQLLIRIARAQGGWVVALVDAM